MAEPRRPRLAETLRGAIDAGLQTVQTRLELLTVELQEEKLRLSAVALNIVLCGLLLGFGFWQLYATRRDQRRADEEAKRRAAGPDGPPQP